MRHKLSIGSWAFVVGQFADNPIGIEEVISKIAEIGFDGIALGGFKPHGHYEIYQDKNSRRKLVNQIHESGLEINSYAPDLINKDYYTGEVNQLEEYRSAFDNSLCFCSDCGIPIMRVDTVTMTPYPKDFDYNRAWDLTVKLFKENARKAQVHDIKIVWEFEPGRIFNKPSEILNLINEVNMENFRIQYDTAHGQMCAVVGAHQYGDREIVEGGQQEFIRSLGNAIGDVHIIDNDNSMLNDKNSNKLTLGKGVIDFESVICEIIRSGYSHEWWTLDIGLQQGDVWRICRDSRLFLKQLFQK
jgi:sugar phosphate isomerase/epimerase